MEFNYKWIRPHMDLKYITSNCESEVYVSNTSDIFEDFFLYANNFYDSAHCIVHYLVEETVDIAKLDLHYFSMVYLYRHSLELMLKANIFKLNHSLSDQINIIRDIRHDLEKGMQKLLLLLNLESNKHISWLLDFCSDISNIDRESDMFRYPFGKDMEILFPQQKFIDLVATHDNFTYAFEILKYIYINGEFPNTEDSFFETITQREPKLIIEGGEYYKQSVVGYKFSIGKFYPIYTSYIECAEFLKKKIIDENRKSLFIPMCYLYRNAIELNLKKIIIENSRLDENKKFKILKSKKHSILGLWNSIKDEIIEYLDSNSEEDTLNNAFNYIQCFHNFDRASDKFRYPCNKNCEVYFANQENFDVENVSVCFEEINNFLDAVDTTFGEYRTLEAEIASYYQSDYDY